MKQEPYPGVDLKVACRDRGFARTLGGIPRVHLAGSAMQVRQDDAILPSEFKPRGAYRARRRFMPGMGALAAGARLTGVHASAYKLDEEKTSFKDVTTYNNDYEHGTGKFDPAENADAPLDGPETVLLMRPSLRNPKTCVFGICLFPPIRLVVLETSGGLGANPIESITHSTGTLTLTGLMLAPSVTPLRRLAGRADVMRYRRMPGLFTFPLCVPAFHHRIYGWISSSIRRPLPRTSSSAPSSRPALPLSFCSPRRRHMP